MAVPAAVKRQLEAAEAGYKADLNAVQGNTDPATQPAIPEPSNASRVDPEDWKERFSRYKAATDPKLEAANNLQQQVAQLSEANRALAQQLETLRQDMAKRSEPTAAAGDVDLSRISKKYGDAYDEDYLKMIADVARDQMTEKEQEIKELRAEIAALKGNVTAVTQTQQKTARDLYYEALDADQTFGIGQKYNWERLGADPAFNDWANTQPVSDFDPRTFAQVLKQADGENNARATLKVLIEYAKQKGLVSTTQQVKPGGRLDALVTPEGAGGGGDPQPQQRTFTKSQVTQFYTDWANKKYTEAAGREIERQILTGTIIPG